MHAGHPSESALDRSAESEHVIEVSFRPQGRDPALPVEVFDREELFGRVPESHRAHRHRADFHVLLVCVEGSGSHVVDFVEYPLTSGTAIRIRPGQTYQYVDLGGLSMFTVIWRAEHHIEEPGRPPWFPGGPEPTRFELSEEILRRVTVWMGELRAEQERFNGSSPRIDLMRTILRGLLMLIDQESGREPKPTALPAAYLELRELLEQELYARPSVRQLAQELGYSTRTLDRACQEVSVQTARQVIDDRVRLELRRLLADESIPIGQVRRSFGFDEATNFTKFVRRVVGQSPGEFRQSFAP
ncbi:MAG: helix-turn-helix domain-containing protein [Acidimicrobiales bacterium]